MNKDELVASVARKANIDSKTAENVINSAIAEAVSAQIFRKGGEVAGIGDTNGCRVTSPLESGSIPSAAATGGFTQLTSEVQREGRPVKVIVQGIEYTE